MRSELRFEEEAGTKWHGPSKLQSGELRQRQQLQQPIHTIELS